MHAPAPRSAPLSRTEPRGGAAPAGPPRRTVLAAALAGTGLLVAATSGCGLRLDRDPEMPALGPADVLRDAVARILAAAGAGDGTDPAGDASSPAAALRVFAAAVGPPWNPPEGLRSPVPAPNPDPAPLKPAAALEALITRIASDAPELPFVSLAAEGADPEEEPSAEHADTFAVLADVSAGALLRLYRADADAARAAADRIRDSAEAALASLPRPADGVGAEASGSEQAETDLAAAGLASLVTAAYQAEYAYERAAVHLREDSPAAAGARERITALAAVAAQASALMAPAAPPADSPAWELRTPPRDHASALTVLLEAEDGLAAALHAARAQTPPPVLLDWLTDSTLARAAAGGGQDLRWDGTAASATAGEARG
ncbi:hypothetical protein [Brevibacterium salitolerans]|uniref:DUF4439 domain-containing protein n=1 Tax=Brevibacterium salitolerans TaxID=1403566 RepID=A0ABP5IRQ5_9MICO